MLRVKVGVPSALRRALVASGEIMAGVVVAHTVAGGEFPPAIWLMAMSGVVLVSSVLALRRPARRIWLVPALVVVQFLSHSVFAAAPTAAHAHHHGHPVSEGAGWPMVAAHLLSALLTAFVWRVRRQLRAVLDCPPVSGRTPFWLAPRVPSPRRSGAWPTILVLGCPRRAPPGMVLAA